MKKPMSQMINKLTINPLDYYIWDKGLTGIYYGLKRSSLRFV